MPDLFSQGDPWSELSDLAADMTKDLPPAIRKVIDTAIANGWELNPPGMTVCLRLNHPSDPVADPVYATWSVGRTKTGKLSYRFDSCCTRGLQPLSGSDLLDYLADPTLGHPLQEELEEEYDAKEAVKAEKAREKAAKWDQKESPEANTIRSLGGEFVRLETERRGRKATPSPRGNTASKPPAKPLRIQAPKA